MEPQLPKQYERALGCLRALLSRAWKTHQHQLFRALVGSDAFRSSFETLATTHIESLGDVCTWNVKDYNTFHDRDKIGWCLYLLTRERENIQTFAPMLVLQYLERHLSCCSPAESQRLDETMRKHISNLAAVERMSCLLDLRRPVFKVLSLLDIHEDRPVSQVLQKIELSTKNLRTSDLELGAAYSPLEKFRMPRGKKDEAWLAQSDSAHKALAQLWSSARGGYQKKLEAIQVLQAHIDPQLDAMRQCESPELLRRREEERESILARHKAIQIRKQELCTQAQLKLAFLESTPAEKANLREKMEISSKRKIKSRPSVVLETRVADTDTLCNITDLPAILYTLKHKSTVHKVVSKLLPSELEDQPQGGSLTWLDFVAAMLKLGFKAEHCGGSAFTFRGGILLPETPECPQKRSITIYRRHPDDSLSPVMLQSIGRRLFRRFGWQRANFAFTK